MKAPATVHSSRVARYNAGGSLDASFGVNGLTTSVINGQIWGAALQSEGKILVSCNAHNFGDTTTVRYSADVSLDRSFETGGIVITSLRAHDNETAVIGVRPDGKIIVGGSSAPADGSYGSNGALVRYNADGTLDKSFDQGDIEILPFSRLAGKSVIQPGGDIVAAGMPRYFGLSVLRFRADGSLDTSFHGAGCAVAPGIQGAAGAIAVQAGGNYVVAGTALEQNSCSRVFWARRRLRRPVWLTSRSMRMPAFKAWPVGLRTLVRARDRMRRTNHCISS